MAKTYGVNLFAANRDMADRVVEYMHVKVMGITYRKRAEREIASIDASIVGLDNLKDSVLADTIPTARLELEKKKADVKVALQKHLEAEGRFQWSDADNKFYKAYTKAETRALKYNALDAWFASYGLKSSIDFDDQFIDALSGKRAASATKIVRSGAETWTAARTKTDIMNTFYGTLCEMELRANIVRPEQIADDIVKAYAPRKKAAKKN